MSWTSMGTPRDVEAMLVRIPAAGVVAYADGERLGPLPATVAAVPSALQVLTPELA
jgi:diacylglycerol kinase (ATP)